MHKDKEAPRQQQLKTKVGNLVKYRFFVIAIISGAFFKKEKKSVSPRVKDPDPVGSVDFLPSGSGSYL